MTETRFARNGDVRLAYEVRGGGPWLLLVHGLGYARWGWEPVVDRLAERFRVLLFDNRGIGESEVPEGPYTAAGMAEDAVAVMDEAGADRAHVLGTSLGGMIAQELAIEHAERVERLVLVATTPGGDLAHPIPARTLDLISRAREMDLEEALRRFVENALSDETVERAPQIVDRILHHRLSNPQDPAGWEAQAAAGTTYDVGGRLGSVRAPTLVVQGTEDAVIDPRNARLLAAEIPDARVEMLPGGGHLPYWEEPERFVELVTRFLPGEEGER